MVDFTLFVAPGSCARVPTIALEEIGVPFETRLVRLAGLEQKTPEFLAVNPKGKVPALVIDGTTLTENVAIISWLNETHPEAGLLPETSGTQEAWAQVADLAFFSGTMHPMVTRIAMPMKFIDGHDPFALIRPKGVADIAPYMAMINERLSERPWWYGDDWSIIDGYLFWIWWRIGVVGYDGSAYPHIADHAARIVERPSVARSMAREDVHIEQLKSEGLYRPHK